MSSYPSFVHFPPTKTCTTNISESKDMSDVGEKLVDGLREFSGKLEMLNEIERLRAENVKLRERVRDQTIATQDAHDQVETAIRNSFSHIGVELGDSSCPIHQRVATAVHQIVLENSDLLAVLKGMTDDNPFCESDKGLSKGQPVTDFASYRIAADKALGVPK